MTKKQIINQTEQFVREISKKIKTPYHGFTHVDRVRKNILKIARAEKADLFLAEITALLHDVGRIKKGDHGDNSAIIAKKYLKQFSEIENKDKEKIIIAVQEHNKPFSNSFLGKLLQDADKLDGFGAMGIIRCFCGGIRRIPVDEMPLRHPGKSLNKERKTWYVDYKDVKSTGDLFYAILSWYDLLNFDSAKKIAKPKVEFMKKYLKELKKDLR